MRAPSCVRLGLSVLLSALGPLVAQAMGVIAVSSPAIPRGGAIPVAFSNYGANRSPPLAWTAVAGARSYALILDDPDAPGSRPFVHWLIWNIPATTTALPAGAATPAAARQGRNDADGLGYFGPRPPSGVHHYHFHLFALNTTLTLSSGADRQALGAAMGGHILAAGEMVATFAAPGGQ